MAQQFRMHFTIKYFSILIIQNSSIEYDAVVLQTIWRQDRKTTTKTYKHIELCGAAACVYNCLYHTIFHTFDWTISIDDWIGLYSLHTNWMQGKINFATINRADTECQTIEIFKLESTNYKYNRLVLPSDKFHVFAGRMFIFNLFIFISFVYVQKSIIFIETCIYTWIYIRVHIHAYIHVLYTCTYTCIYIFIFIFKNWYIKKILLKKIWLIILFHRFFHFFLCFVKELRIYTPKFKLNLYFDVMDVNIQQYNIHLICYYIKRDRDKKDN